MNYITSIFITGSIVTMLSACSGGGGDSAPATPIGDITGSWSVTSTDDATACGDGTNVDYYSLNVTSQSGSEISYTSNGNNFTGILSGNKLTSSGSYPKQGGTTTGSTTLTIDSTCSAFSGTGTWSWTDGTSPCSGTSKLSGTRNNSTGCGNVNASYDTESEPNDAVNVANTLTAGAPMKGSTTSTPPDDDIYKFTVPATARYRFNLSYDTSNTLNLVLRNESLTELYRSYTYIQSSVDFTAGTVFYIQIDPITTSTNIPYTLTVDAI